MPVAIAIFLHVQNKRSHRRCSVRKGVLRPATLLKKCLWHRCFPVNFAKFLRAPFYKTSLGDCFSQNNQGMFIDNLRTLKQVKKWSKLVIKAPKKLSFLEDNKEVLGRYQKDIDDLGLVIYLSTLWENLIHVSTARKIPAWSQQHKYYGYL